MAGETGQEKLEVILQIKDLATAALQRFETRTEQAGKKSEDSFKKSERAVDQFKQKLKQAGVVLLTYFGARKVISTLTSFEQGLVGVGKTADISGTALEGLGDQFVDLSRKIPVGVNQLLEIGRAAGQLGVTGAGNILKFTETVARLAAASSDFQGEEAATTLARFLTVTGEGVGDVDRLASTITQLGNTTAATEREIALAGLSVGQATAQYKIGAATAAAYGAALSQLGIQTDLAGSTIGRTFRAIDQALRDQGKGAHVLTEITGRSIKELSEIFRRDADAGFRVFLAGLNNIVETGGNANQVLSDLNIADIRLQKVLPVLAQNYDLLNRKVDEGRGQWAENNALFKESERAFATLGSSLLKLGNTFSAAILGIRDNRDALNEMVQTATRVVEHFFGLESATGRFSAGVVVLSTAIKIATSALVGFAVAKVVTWLVSVVTYLKQATVALLAFNFAARANPIVALASVIAAAGTAMFLFSGHAEAATTKLGTFGQTAERVSDAMERLAHAQQTRDLDRQAQHLRTIIEGLKSSSEELFKRSKTGNIQWSDLLGIDPSLRGSKEFQDQLNRVQRLLPLTRPESGFRGEDPTKFAERSYISLADAIAILERRLKVYQKTYAEVSAKQKAEGEKGGPFGGIEAGANKAVAAIDKIVAGLENERRALEFSKDDQDEATVVRQYGLQLMKLEGYEFDAQFERLVQHVKKTRELREELERLNEERRKAEIPVGFKAGFTSVVSQFDTAAERLTILGESTAQAMLDVFTIEFFDPMTGRFKSLEDIARSTLLNIANAIQKVISQQIALAAVSGIAGGLGINLAKLGQGGIVQGGRFMRAQQGVVVNAPTVISGGNGPGVLAGEAHQPEGVFPLVRDKSGDLGVRAVGGGGNSITITYAPVIQTQSGTDNNGLAQLLRNDFDRQMSRWFVGQMSRGTPVRRSVIDGVKKG